MTYYLGTYRFMNVQLLHWLTVLSFENLQVPASDQKLAVGMAMERG